MRRVPFTDSNWDARPTDGTERLDHAHLQHCGRPVETDGLCRFHARQRDRDDELRLWRSTLRKVGR